MNLLRSAIAALATIAFAAGVAANPAAIPEKWWSFKASYTKGPGLTEVNIALNDKAPYEDYPVLITTGVTYPKTNKAKDSEGLPEAKDAEHLKQVGKDVVALVRKNADAIYAGSFTYAGDMALYFYAKDGQKAEKALQDYYKAKCPDCKGFVTVSADQVWMTYRLNLYPNAATRKWYAKEWAELTKKP